ncbi:MAG: hypothetical protein EA369_09510 [Bradymonadales bacterium]|nr:MAG: hypothetical protein EA369_09510 [Bradymonadales bacterium]
MRKLFVFVAATIGGFVFISGHAAAGPNRVDLIHSTNAVFEFCGKDLFCSTRIRIGGVSYAFHPSAVFKGQMREIEKAYRTCEERESGEYKVGGFFAESRGHSPDPSRLQEVFHLIFLNEITLPICQGIAPLPGN